MLRRRLFTVAAVAEAVSWTGLLLGMFFKYVVVRDDLGVRVFGPIHGALFVLYVVAVLVARGPARWGVVATLVGLAASIPPFGTLVFERWAARCAAPAPAARVEPGVERVGR